MLTISAQWTPPKWSGIAAHEPGRLVVFVADEDGERIFEDDASVTLDDIAEGDGMSGAVACAIARSVDGCLSFCADKNCRDPFISPAIEEAFEAARADLMEQLLRN